MLFGILGANRTEDLLVARNEIVSSYYYFFSWGGGGGGVWAPIKHPSPSVRPAYV